MVVFDETRVAPLFEASGDSFCNYWSRPQKQAMKRNRAQNIVQFLGPIPQNLNRSALKGKDIVMSGTRKVLHIPSGQLAFLPPQASDLKRDILNKRVFERKVRDIKRGA